MESLELEGDRKAQIEAVTRSGTKGANQQEQGAWGATQDKQAWKMTR